MKSEATGFGFMRRYISYLSRRMWYVVAVVTLVAAMMFTIGWIVGQSSLSVELEEVTARYEKLEAEYMAFQAEHEKSSKPGEEISYSRHYKIDMYHIKAASVALGKGDVFAARMSFSGAIIFWIYDPTWGKVVDAGSIEGEYEFTFTVEQSGTHILVFKEIEGTPIIDFYYNSPSPLADASVRQ